MPIGRASLAAVGLLLSSSAFAGTVGWSLSEASGQVMIASTGVARIALRGGSVAAGDTITTGRNGRAVLVRGKEYLVVAPNTRIRVADPAKAGGITQIVESFGNVIYKIKKMTMPHFAVETPFLAAVVKGTIFSVTVTDKGATVQVIEGRVEVTTRDGGASSLVLPGDIGSVSANAPATLTVQGRTPQIIHSPTPAAAAAAVAASVTPGAADAPEPISAERSATVIATAIGEGAVNLASLSGGMVQGDPSFTALDGARAMPTRLAQNLPLVVPVALPGAVPTALPGAVPAALPVAALVTVPVAVPVAAGPIASAGGGLAALPLPPTSPEPLPTPFVPADTLPAAPPSIPIAPGPQPLPALPVEPVIILAPLPEPVSMTPLPGVILPKPDVFVPAIPLPDKGAPDDDDDDDGDDGDD